MAFGDVTGIVGGNNFCSSFNAAVRIGVPAKDAIEGFRNSSQPCNGRSVEGP